VWPRSPHGEAILTFQEKTKKKGPAQRRGGQGEKSNQNKGGLAKKKRKTITPESEQKYNASIFK